jgi:hypothetical protein
MILNLHYGVYFYCNNRLIIQSDKSYDFGFTPGQAGVPHPQLNPMRVLVYLNGSPQQMPWNSSKSGINFRNRIFQLIRPKIVQLVIYYARLARKLVGNVEQNIYKYDSGEIHETTITDFSKPFKLYNLPPPIKGYNYSQEIIKKNEKLSNKKPWVVGLFEGIILVEDLVQTSFVQKNRFSLIILDSTLEIAFKEYLTHITPKIGKSKLINILQNRALVEAEIKSRVAKITGTEWGLINHYYNMRNNLIHQVASSDVQIEDINKCRNVVQKVLAKLFGIVF